MREILCESYSRSSNDLAIASTKTSAGKNLLICGLLRVCKQRRVQIKPFKPLEIDNFNPVETPLQPGIYLQAHSAGVPVEGSMNPIRVVYGWGNSFDPPDLYLCGNHKGKMSCNCLAEADTRNEIEKAAKTLKGDGSRLIIEVPGAFSESYTSPAITVLLEALQPDIILIGDFLRGGGLASLVGTLELVPKEIRTRVVGVVLNHLDESAGGDYPKRCRQELRDRFNIGIVGMLPTWTEGFDTISEDRQVLPDFKTFDAQVDRLATEIEARFHPAFLDQL